MAGGSGISGWMDVGCGGGGGESGRGFWERCEPNRSSRERCFCFMLLEMMCGPLLEGGEGWVLREGCSISGSIGGGGGTHFICMQ